jgi:hypothetical protein
MQAGDAEVEDLGLAVLVHQHVAGLEVAMHDAAFVRVVRRARQLGDQAQARGEIGLEAAEVAAQVRAAHHFQCKPGRGQAAEIVFAGGVQTHDAGMFELCQQRDFAPEALQHRAGHAAHHFQRHLARRVRLLRQIHAPHAAFAQQAQDAVRPDAFGQHRGLRRVIELEGRCCSAGRTSRRSRAPSPPFRRNGMPGMSGYMWCSIWWLRLPLMMCMRGRRQVAEPRSWRRYQWPRVRFPARPWGRFGVGGEVAAEDDGEGPEVADQVGGEVAGSTGRKNRAGQQREEHVVLEQLACASWRTSGGICLRTSAQVFSPADMRPVPGSGWPRPTRTVSAKMAAISGWTR